MLLSLTRYGDMPSVHDLLMYDDLHVGHVVLITAKTAKHNKFEHDVCHCHHLKVYSVHVRSIM
jgi:hypothetical protein